MILSKADVKILRNAVYDALLYNRDLLDAHTTWEGMAIDGVWRSRRIKKYDDPSFCEKLERYILRLEKIHKRLTKELK